ncbi:MAG: hypothetical protein ACREEV_06590, partial [Dongiaceae bacterium]
MKQADLAALAALAEALPAAEPPELKMLTIKEKLDPVALSGTDNVRLAERLAHQVATCQAVPHGV